ncbi:hypothetical protein LTS01_024925, partial [Friedmanniomyces endolithicus]
MFLYTLSASTDIRAELPSSLVQVATEGVGVTRETGYRRVRGMWVDYLIRCLRDLAEASNMRTDLSALDLGNSSMKITKVGRKRVGRNRNATDSTSEDVILGKGFEDIVEDVH